MFPYLIIIFFAIVGCSTKSIQKNDQAMWRKDCRDGVCIFVTQLKDKSENFEVESSLSHPIKLTILVEFANAKNAPIVNKGEVTKFINPKEKVHLLTLDTEKNEDEVLFNYRYWWQ